MNQGHLNKRLIKNALDRRKTPNIIKIILNKIIKILATGFGKKINNNPKTRLIIDCTINILRSFLICVLIAIIINKTQPNNNNRPIVIIKYSNVILGNAIANIPIIKAIMALIIELFDVKTIFHKFFTNLPKINKINNFTFLCPRLHILLSQNICIY